MRIVKAGSASGTSFLLFAFIFASTCPAQVTEASIDSGSAQKILGSSFLQDQVPKVAEKVDFFSPDSVRDREALALLLAEYSRRTSEWAPSADWSWGVLSVNVIYGYPIGKRIWLELQEISRWRELLLSQGGREPQMVRSRPEILVMFTEKDCFFVYPGRILGSSEAKVIVVFGRQFYRKRHVQGVLQGEIGKDFLAAWQRADEARNPRAEAEMVQRLIWMAGEMSRLGFLVSNGNLERVLACLDHPEKNTSQCADTIWEYELTAAKTMLSASQRLEFCPRTERCDQESQFKIVTPPLAMVQFFQPDIRIQTSLRNYLEFLLPKSYKKQQAFFKKYWSKRG
jgi:hypothetical protein